MENSSSYGFFQTKLSENFTTGHMVLNLITFPLRSTTFEAMIGPKLLREAVGATGNRLATFTLERRFRALFCPVIIGVAGTVNACRGEAPKPIQAQAVSSARKERENAMARKNLLFTCTGFESPRFGRQASGLHSVHRGT